MIRLTVAILSILLLLSPTDSQSDTDWTWVYPKTTGNALNGVVTIDAMTLVAVGDYGTVVRTADAGNSWLSEYTIEDITGDLNAITALSATRLVAVGDGGVILASDDAGISWAVVNVSISTDLIDVSAADDMSVVAIGKELFFKSVDGGATWLNVPVDILTEFFASIDCITPDFIVMAGDWSAFYRSYDGGQNWDASFLPTYRSTNNLVEFFDTLNGIVMSTDMDWGGHRTRDGGDTWTDIFGPYIHHGGVGLGDLAFPDTNTIVGAGRTVHWGTEPARSEFGSLYVTHDDASWVSVSHSVPVHGIDLQDDGSGYAVGARGTVHRVAAGATSWTRIGGAYQYVPYAIMQTRASFLDSQRGIVVSGAWAPGLRGKSAAVRTTDGGQTWIATYPTRYVVQDVAYVNPTAAYVVGTEIQKSEDGGETWSEIHPPAWLTYEEPQFRAVDFVDMSAGIAVGKEGLVAVISNDVVTLPAAPTAETMLDVDMIDASAAVMVGEGGTIFRSADGGETWNPQTSGTTASLYCVDMVGQSVGFVVGASGLILKTTDGGATWTPQSSGTDVWLYTVRFADGLNGIIAGGSGVILATEDGGATWVPREGQPTEEQLTDVVLNGSSMPTFYTSTGVIFIQGPLPIPVLFQSFVARAVADDVHLEWAITTDEALRGFRIYRKDGDAGHFVVVHESNGAGLTSYVDRDAREGVAYHYVVAAVHLDGSETRSLPQTVSRPASSGVTLRSYPNPFNPTTQISYSIEEALHVNLRIVDVTGAHVVTLVNTNVASGVHRVEWDGRDSRGQAVAAGTYFCRLRAGKTTTSLKMSLVK